MKKPIECCRFSQSQSLQTLQRNDHHYEKDFSEIIYLTKGKGAVNTFDYEIQDNLPRLIYVPKSVNSVFIPFPDARGYAVRFKTEFLPVNKVDFFMHYFSSYDMQVVAEHQQKAILHLFELMQPESVAEAEEDTSMHYLLLALLAKIEFIRRTDGDGDVYKDRDYDVCKRFMQLLEAHFYTSHKVSFYARELHITFRSLNEMVLRVTGKTVLQLIDMRRYIEARKLLIQSDRSISEIAYMLGFTRTYFTRFFQKKAGVTPLYFRQTCQLV
ncbi:AraC-type DNA-binding protein [Filimonas lacunae]|uniref:AraC-type DNA-binding protein n=1 Tax=Filimonas lacunae TaxID=477680 RepID=A0A173MMN7_9BACT|nr:AraC family transcriptional regulator [Filimonas lacunae]BAV08915.1 transcriptional regulator, AraC family [Filimonas lacunae]SIS63939.1 AraC-type DNA-binding protein [Filimonas lacunae]